LSYAYLLTQYHAFVSFFDSHPNPKYVSDAMSHPGWRAMMEDEMAALEKK